MALAEQTCERLASLFGERFTTSRGICAEPGEENVYPMISAPGLAHALAAFGTTLAPAVKARGCKIL